MNFHRDRGYGVGDGCSILLTKIWHAPRAVIQKQWCYAYLLHQDPLHYDGSRWILSYATLWTRLLWMVARLESKNH